MRLLLFFPLRSFLGIVRLVSPNSAAIPNSRSPRKSSPKESAKLPLMILVQVHDIFWKNEYIRDEFSFFLFAIFLCTEECIIIPSFFGSLQRKESMRFIVCLNYRPPTASLYALASFFSSSESRPP